jgi:hypothetical protein
VTGTPGLADPRGVASVRSVSNVRVQVAGGSLVGSRAGEGEPALLLHGGPGLADYTGPLADELASHFEVIGMRSDLQRRWEPALMSRR